MQSRLEQLAELSHEQLVAKLMAAEAPRAQGKLTIKTSTKGCVQVLGIGSKFGITLYPEVWYTLLEESMRQRILDHIVTEQAALSFKRGIPALGIEPSAQQAGE